MGDITFKRYVGLMAIYAKMDLGALLRDTKFMLVALISDICADISAISGIFLLAWKFDGIGGLDKYEILFMANIYPIIFAVLLSLAAAYFFKKGFRYYVKKGINRYHASGHRN